MLKTLQAGRAFAAVGVAAYHLSITMGLERYGHDPVFQHFTRYGYLGVDFFFVLSGFIILHAHSLDIGQPSKWRKYAYRRLVRIYPVYWLYTAVFVAVLSFDTGTDAKMPGNFPDWLTAISLIRVSAAAPPLPIAWTLYHELAFYLLFLILILNRRIGIATCIVLSVVWLTLFNFPSEDSRSAFNVYFSAINIEFLFGMGSYWLFKSIRTGTAAIAMGAVVFLVAASLLPRYEGIAVRVLFAMSVAFITAGVSKLEFQKRLTVPALLAFVGDASYSIYLVHLPLEGLFLKVFSKLGLRGLIPTLAVYFMVIFATIAAGCIAYLSVERPLMNMLKKLKAAPSRIDVRPA